MEKLAREAVENMEDHDFMGAFSQISEIATLGNTNLAKHEFWNLIKADPETEEPSVGDLDLLEELLYLNFELVRILSVLLVPYCPETASRMLTSVSEGP